MSAGSGLARTPEPPYYAVIFTSLRNGSDPEGYAAMAQRMIDLGSRYDGFLGVESVRGADGVGITVSYWRDEAAILAWRRDPAHRQAQRGGHEVWYDRFEMRVARVERAYGFARDGVR